MNTNPLFTNVLLVIIAGLLLVQVIQNGMNQNLNSRPSFVSSESSNYAPPEHPSNPSVNPNAGQMGHNMFFMAIKAFPEGCQGKKILDECDSPAAQAVKQKIESVVSEGKGPRQIFDFVVATWGENVLTDQALQIRKMRKPSK